MSKWVGKRYVSLHGVVDVGPVEAATEEEAFEKLYAEEIVTLPHISQFDVDPEEIDEIKEVEDE